LPRTDSITPAKAVEFIQKTYNALLAKGAKPNSVCFIIHKFIPAVAAAWAYASPDTEVVKIDSLWGVPDGLQYFPHDSFEIDVKRKRILSERLRYKPYFIQELESGEWRKIQVSRASARSRSLSTTDLQEVAGQTMQLAKLKKAEILVMWFCDIPADVGIGKNLPWFSMKPQTIVSETAAPRKKPFFIRNINDIENAYSSAKDHILVLDPDVHLIRDNEFKDKVIELAKSKNIPVRINGTTLGHAYYILRRGDIAVYPYDMPKYSLARGKQKFRKLVRDDIPRKIRESGEKVLLAKIRKEDTRSALIVKLIEEAFELKAAQTPDEVSEELADVLEVVKSLAEAANVDWKEVQDIAQKKREERGSFKDSIVLMETSLPINTTAKDSPPLVPLWRLAETLKKEEGVEITFPGLLADSGIMKAQLPDGSNVSVSLSSKGVFIKLEKTLGEDDGRQLSFFEGSEN
jgi:predicted house-cleaning noncanonical NTP pyrophosphatase (MazG superfamily)